MLFTFVTILSICVFINYQLFDVIHHFLRKRSQRYVELPEDKKRYVIKNLTKSCILLMLLFKALPEIWLMFVHNIWNNFTIQLIGCVYVSTDVSGLLFVPNLSRATKMHHISVLIIGILNMYVDYSQQGIHRAFVYLTILSMLPYMVNTYLAVRFLEDGIIKKGSLYLGFGVYALSITCNCLLQHFHLYIINSFILNKLVYLMLYYTILMDDIVLLGFLCNKIFIK